MQPLMLGGLLDDGGRELARLLGGLAVLVLLALLLAVAVPVRLLTGPAAAQRLDVAAGPRPSPAAAKPAAGAAGVVERSVPPRPAAAAGSRAVDVARGYLGVPYVFGGVDPARGLDCSGLVQLVFHQLGVGLPRTAQLQYDSTARVGRDELQPGDLVFFARTYADPRDWITHVGIYLGDGLQINAPTTGQVVSIQPVFSGFWGAHYAGAGRVAAP